MIQTSFKKSFTWLSAKLAVLLLVAGGTILYGPSSQQSISSLEARLIVIFSIWKQVSQKKSDAFQKILILQEENAVNWVWKNIIIKIGA